MNPITYLILRLAVGVSFFGHGLVRMPKLQGFSNWMVHSFEKSMLPEAIVLPFSYILPFAELITGILLLLGLFTRGAIYLGAIVMMILIFGSTMIESWEAIVSQLIHIAFLAVILHFIAANQKSVDAVIKK